ncbi:UNVERIFIED_CONTAM: hypothetical protein K2H54_024995, partial [Gekko kuhli]
GDNEPYEVAETRAGRMTRAAWMGLLNHIFGMLRNVSLKLDRLLGAAPKAPALSSTRLQQGRDLFGRFNCHSVLLSRHISRAQFKVLFASYKASLKGRALNNSWAFTVRRTIKEGFIKDSLGR